MIRGVPWSSSQAKTHGCPPPRTGLATIAGEVVQTSRVAWNHVIGRVAFGGWQAIVAQDCAGEE
ncbi:hypothetical protein PLICRDRAFT_638940 [Plicaturopsis crispa FD-325 SS-3]|nr:hypothetical protein PLICRDRAFT_638940 [Plicaturopsis crispa FD-325 SS-3]